MHDIPEGISMAVPLKKGMLSNIKVLLLVAISGLFTGVGAFVGAAIGNVSKDYISISLSIAAGTMVYISFCNLIPKSYETCKSNINNRGTILGFMVRTIFKIALICIDKG